MLADLDLRTKFSPGDLLLLKVHAVFMHCVDLSLFLSNPLVVDYLMFHRLNEALESVKLCF